MALVGRAGAVAAAFKKAVSAVGLVVANSARADLTASPTITSGTGAASVAEPNGSIYLRTDGATDTTIYVRAAGAWVACVVAS